MKEFDTVSVSSFDAASLAGKLTEKSAEGWDVVAIVPAGSEVTAYLRREATATAGATDAIDATDEDRAAEQEPVEPAGWGTAPASSSTESGWDSSSGTAAASAGWGSSSVDQPTTVADAPIAVTSQPAATTTSTAAAAASAVPPGWYADPSGRYELRYWDGAAWTEHVARQGQQYTDPPVA